MSAAGCEQAVTPIITVAQRRDLIDRIHAAFTAIRASEIATQVYIHGGENQTADADQASSDAQAELWTAFYSILGTDGHPTPSAEATS